VKVSAEAARRFLIARHLLAPARSVKEGPDAVLEVFRRLGSIQFDPIAVAGRSHDLVLHARVADYEPAWCGHLYERREIFEAYNKGLSFVQTNEFAWFRATVSKDTPARTLSENADVAERVLDEIRTRGPLSALDFERERGTTTDWFGMPTNAVKAVLEALRPARATPTRRGARTRRSTQGAAPAQDALPLPRSRVLGCERQR
jgi:uncharacterized protein